MKYPPLALAVLLPALAAAAAQAQVDPDFVGPPVLEDVLPPAAQPVSPLPQSLDPMTESAIVSLDSSQCMRGQSIPDMTNTESPATLFGPPPPSATPVAINSLPTPAPNRPAAVEPAAAENPTDLSAVGASMGLAPAASAPQASGKTPLAVGPASSDSGGTSANAPVDGNNYTYDHIRRYVDRTDSALQDARDAAKHAPTVNAASADQGVPDDNRSAGGSNLFGTRK